MHSVARVVMEQHGVGMALHGMAWHSVPWYGAASPLAVLIGIAEHSLVQIHIHFRLGCVCAVLHCVVGERGAGGSQVRKLRRRLHFLTTSF